jgi:hypothetical protein
MMNKTLNSLVAQNTRLARRIWGITGEQVSGLRSLTKEFRLSVSRGDLKLLNGHWYVTNSGLLRLAWRNRCASIMVSPVREFSEPEQNRWVFRAAVHKVRKSRPFVGFGDADPTNVSELVRGAELRIAETRAVNRALRKAYGIGLCSVEELGMLSNSRTASSNSLPTNVSSSSNGNGQPRLRDQLCLLIRQYNLDANLVKAYAADFCGTETIRGASRELVESFIAHLSTAAKENRDALVCKLNSYSRQVEVQS